MAMERTCVIIKPSGVQRGLVGQILSRFEARGLKIVGLKMMQISEELAREHYREHEGKPFFNLLLERITKNHVVVIALEGVNAIQNVRKMIGSTDPSQAAPGTIRGDFASSTPLNLIHGSDSAESAARELSLFFAPHELHNYERSIDEWLMLEE